MSQKETGQRVNDICSIILREISAGPRDFFLYTEVDDGVIAPRMVQIYPDTLVWTLPPWDIAIALDGMWRSADKDAKWWALTLEIHGDKFEIQFSYDPGAQYDEETNERAQAAIKARFPAFSIHYPPVDQKAIELEMMQRSVRRSASFELGPSGATQSDHEGN